ncbi:semaphorin-3D-like [Hippoglossus stenolepis]|uniref:semaphorin-3D-like n=1 Tax=Hippoglossus stenolepis TaxID=195615 RepID=UPI001FAE979B|nr:semaphorin-3D-like [Hippoglossus stenolepis]
MSDRQDKTNAETRDEQNVFLFIWIQNDVGGKRSLINRWTTFLKARLVCSVPGPSGVDTHFDELEDIFVLETKDPQNPTIYGVFSTSSSIFRGSAVCVYSMASIRAAFNGPIAETRKTSREMTKIGKAHFCVFVFKQMKKMRRRKNKERMSPTPVLSMELSTKRQQLYVSSELSVAQLGLQRCELYGTDCAKCCLARDPYCSWDGQTCSRTTRSEQLPHVRQTFPSFGVRRARRQDVKYGDPWSQCPVPEDDSASVEEKSLYGVEGNSTFLECVPRAPQAELRWTVQRHTGSSQQTEDRLPLSDDDRSLHMKRGLLVQRPELADAGLYACTSHEHSYSQVLARYRVHIIPNHSLHPAARHQQSHGPHHGKTDPPSSLPGLRNSWLPQHQSYKDLHTVGTNSLSVDEDCEQLWYREKRRQQKLRTLKLKQESRKARVRRNNPPELPL